MKNCLSLYPSKSVKSTDRQTEYFIRDIPKKIYTTVICTSFGKTFSFGLMSKYLDGALKKGLEIIHNRQKISNIPFHTLKD